MHCTVLLHFAFHKHDVNASDTGTNARLSTIGLWLTAQRARPMSDAAWVIFIRYTTRDLPADVNTNHPAKGTMMSPRGEW